MALVCVVGAVFPEVFPDSPNEYGSFGKGSTISNSYIGYSVIGLCIILFLTCGFGIYALSSVQWSTGIY